jgi:uncharacterized membrane protein YfhO
MLREGINDLLLETRAADNSILLLTDTYYYGWTASVDGDEAEILKANYAFKAVAVPSGEHQVHFKFVHKRFVAGMIVSMVSISVLALLVAGRWIQRIAQRRAAQRFARAAGNSSTICMNLSSCE